MVGKGLEISIIAELLLYASAGLVPMALPLSVLLSSLMTFGNLGENYELIALKSAGISLQRIMFPLIIIVIIISIGAFYFSNNIMPYTNLKFGSLLYDVRHQKPEIDIKEGVFYNGIDGYSIKIAKKNKKNNLLYNLMIYDHSKRNGNLTVTIADSGTMKISNDKKYLILTLFKGHTYSEIKEEKKKRRHNTFPHRRDNFDEQKIVFELIGYGMERTDENLFKNNYQMLNVKQLEFTEDSLSGTLDKSKREFSNNLLRINYFKKENKKKYTKPDTILQLENEIKNTIILNIDSVFEIFSYRNKEKSIEMALNYARSSKSYISSTKSLLEGKNRWINKHKIEWHRKFTLSFACFILFFIGAPLGAIIRKGGLGMPVVISVLFFILYYVISITGEKNVKADVIPAFYGMWLSAFIVFPLGIFLTYKATTDSVILNIDTYFEFFKKLLHLNNKSDVTT